MTSLLFTEDAQAAFDYARGDALRRHSQYIDVEHLLLGLLATSQVEPLGTLLPAPAREQAASRLTAEMAMLREPPLEQIQGVTAVLQKVMLDAAQQAENLGHQFINAGHLLLALFAVPQEPVQAALQALNVDEATLSSHVATHSPAPSPAARAISLESVAERRVRRRQQAQTQQPGNSLGLYVLLGALVFSVVLLVLRLDLFISFWVVLLGWVLSVSVHEFAHALVAYWGGDHSVKEKGYLTFNPLKYTHPFVSVVLPIIILLWGGLPLPGGAVYIERHRLRSREWESLVSLAGPIGTLLAGIAFAFPFWSGLVDVGQLVGRASLLYFQSPRFYESMLSSAEIYETRFWSAIAVLAFLQVLAFFFNLIPIPPLDGFGVIEPFLPPHLARQARSLGLMGIFLVFFLFWQVDAIATPFYENSFRVLEQLGVDSDLVAFGFEWFMFWS